MQHRATRRRLAMALKRRPQPDKQQNGRETDSDQSIAKSTRNIARLTGVLAVIAIASAIVTAGQWWEIHSGSEDTKRLVNAANNQATAAAEAASAAKISATSASKSAEAFVEIERPRLVLASANIIQPQGPTDPHPYIGYSFVNMGRMPAVIRLIYKECLIADSLPDYQEIKKSKFSVVQITLAPNTPMPVDDKRISICSFDLEVTEDDYRAVAENRKYIILKLMTAYDGAFSAGYTFSTAVIIAIGKGATNVIGGDAYNYEQKSDVPVHKRDPFPPPKILP